MGEKIEVAVYQDHFIVTMGNKVNVVWSDEELGGFIRRTASPESEKKRTYPKGVRRQRKPKPEATATGAEGGV